MRQSPIAGSLLICAALLGLAAPAGAARPPKPDTNDFILRAPASEIAGIAYRNDLVIVDEVDASPDALGRSVYLVRAPEGTPPEQVLAAVEALEPAAVNIEEVFLASLPETLDGPALDQSSMAILSALGEAQKLRSPSALAAVDWLGGAGDRTLAAGQARQLVLELSRTADPDETGYALGASFAEGAAVDFAPGGACVAGANGWLDFNNEKIEWRLINTGLGDLTIAQITLAWPAVNGDLQKIHLGGDEIFDKSRAPSSTVVDGSWRGGPSKRRLGPGESQDLRLEFEHDALADEAGYDITVEFAEGCGVELSTGPSAVGFGLLEISGSQVAWTVLNTGATPLTLEGLALAWPEVGGTLLGVRLDDAELFAAEPVDLPHGTQADGSPRFVWRAYLEQPAALSLRVAEATATHKGRATVAIIDTGVDPYHPLLAERLVPGYDFLTEQPGPASEWADLDQSSMAILSQSSMAILSDEEVVPLSQSSMAILSTDQSTALDPAALPPAFGHGTMVAGIVHRVTPAASIMPLRAFDGWGYGNLFDVVRAIHFAVDNGAHVINMSFSLETFSPELMRAVNYAARKGVVCVAAAGNKGREILVLPAALGNALGVAATTDDDRLSVFSNRGNDLVTVAAPGESLLTSFPGGGWALATGTSFAAPWISGAAAVFIDKNGRQGLPGRADYYLAAEALSWAAPVQDDPFGAAGHGRADLALAVEKLRKGTLNDNGGAAESTYSIEVVFAEGCSVSFPPATTGNGCSVEVETQLTAQQKQIRWRLTNVGDQDATIASVTVSWPEENGALQKMELTKTFYQQSLDPASATISSGWKGKVADRRIGSGQSEVFKLQFAHTAAPH